MRAPARWWLRGRSRPWLCHTRVRTPAFAAAACSPDQNPVKKLLYSNDVGIESLVNPTPGCARPPLPLQPAAKSRTAKNRLAYGTEADTVPFSSVTWLTTPLVLDSDFCTCDALQSWQH
jgi:hypothetical protein